MKKGSIYNTLYAFSAVLLTILAAAVIFDIAFFSHGEYLAKKEFVIPAFGMFCLAALLIWMGGKCHRAFSDRKLRFPMALALVVFFIYQIFVAQKILFLSTSWDTYRVLHNVYLGVTGDIVGMDMDYFSYFPNNRGIFLLEYMVCKGISLVAPLTMERALFALVILQSALSTATAYFLYDLLLHFADELLALLGFFLYVITLGLSGWQVVVYTDMIAILFPILMFWLYTKKEEWKHPGMAWPLIFVCGYGGYLIKPTVLIMLIALCGTEFFRMAEHFLTEKGKQGSVVEKEPSAKARLSALAVSVAAVVFLHLAFTGLLGATPLVQDPEKNTGVWHMLMMGLNDENDGAISVSDVAFSQSFPDRVSRTAAQKERIAVRLSSYGVPGFVKFMAKKALVVFNDGTYAWGEEADFYGTSYHGDGVLHRFYDSLYRTDGRWYGVKKYPAQIIWYGLLLLCFFTGFLKEKKTPLPLVAALIGIMVFDMLFEARARYLLVYAPVFILTGLLNLTQLEPVETLRSSKE